MNNIIKEKTNSAVITGKVVSEPVKTHTIEGEGFYEFKIESARNSNVPDVIPVVLPERVKNKIGINVGDNILIDGEVRSINRYEGDHRKLIVYLFAKSFELHNTILPNENRIELTGFVCKPPIFRVTPFGREICDVTIAVNRVNGRSDYIPVILWGRNAQFFANQSVGTKFSIYGRLQSRNYNKTLPDGTIQPNTTYEVSVNKVEVLDNTRKFQNNENAKTREAN